MAALGSAIALHSAIGDDNSQWVHILPVGRVTGRDGRGPYELVDARSVMQSTREYHGRKLMLVDFEHQSMLTTRNGQPAPAAGWISALKAEPDGVWGLVTWTAHAAEQIRAKAYRYLSPVFSHDPKGVITRLRSVALTNTPNLELTALARSEETSMDETALNELRSLLGLAADADFASIRDAINGLKTSANSANPDPSRFVPIGDFERVVADANKLRQGVSHNEAVAHVERSIASGKVAPFLKDWAVSLCSVNKPAFDAFLDRTGPAFATMFTAQTARAHGPGDRQPALTDEEKTIAAALGLTEAQYVNGRAAD